LKRKGQIKERKKERKKKVYIFLVALGLLLAFPQSEIEKVDLLETQLERITTHKPLLSWNFVHERDFQIEAILANTIEMS